MSRSDWQQRFEINPIFLTGGIAGGMAGGTLSILTLTQGNALTGGVTGGALGNPDEYFAHWSPVPGGTLNSYAVGTYPFASQQVAANAMIGQPLSIALLMTCPAKNPGDYDTKQAVLTALKASIDQHVAGGGTFAVATPAFFYSDCLLTSIRDATGGESRQVDYRWIWEFTKPLVTLSESQQSQNNLMGRLANGGQIDGAPNWSDPANAGGDPASGVSPPASPTASQGAGLGFASADRSSNPVTTSAPDTNLLGGAF